MSDDRDLDELLESLDALLREGESHNDDAEDAEAPLQTPHVAVKTVVSTPPEPKAEAVIDAMPEAEEGEAEFTSAAQVESEAKAEEEEIPHFLAEEQDAGEDAEAVADEAVEEEDVQNGNTAAAAPVHRVILTEDMLVDNHQEALPLKPAAAAKEHTADDAPALNASSLDPEQMKQLAALVRRDITLQLQAKLPQWIEQSINKHLQEATEQTKDSNQ